MEDIKVLLTRLMDEYGSYLKQTAYVMVGDQSLAEDLVQETFFSFYRSHRQFRNEASYKTYLYRILMNHIKMHCRKKRPVAADEPSEMDFGMVTFEDHTVLLMDLHEAIRSLKSKYAEVIVLHYFNELTIEEISELQGVTKSGVKMRLKRAKEQLEKELKGDNQYETLERLNG